MVLFYASLGINIGLCFRRIKIQRIKQFHLALGRI